MTTAEAALQALGARIAAGLPSGAVFQRGGVLPTRIPAVGIAILRDGDPGEPEAWLSPPGFYYEHLAELELVVDRPTPEQRAVAFDVLKAAVGTALATDRTLGGLVDHVEPRAAAAIDLPVDGADGLKAASIRILLAYATTDPLL
jgi:hypothetical protein